MNGALISSPESGHRTRVLQLFSRYRELGGEEGSVYRIGDTLQREYDVGFFLTSSADSFSGDVVRRGVSVLKAFSNWSVVSQLRRYQELGRYDLWQIHNVFPAMSPAVYALAFRLGVPVIQYLHNYRLGCVNGFFLNHGTPCQTCMHGNFGNAFRTACWHGSHLQSGVMGLITAHARRMDLFHRISHWIAISKAQKREHVAMGVPEERITVIPHFYEPSRTPPPPHPTKGDALFVGRLSAEKGVDRLLRAWRHIHDCGRTLRIVGEGPERPGLEAMTRSEGIRNVLFTGFLHHREMEAVWAASACSIIPSVWKEPFGMVVLEAWAKGRPVVAHSVGALPEIIDHGVDGLLVSENDSGELAGSILSLLDNPSRAAAMGLAGSVKLRERHSRDAWLASIRPVFSKVLGRE